MRKILTNESNWDPEVSVSQHARILIVDDEPHVCEILSRWLMEEGHDCATAASGEQAWELLQQGDYSLLVSDIMMPGMTGIDLFLMTKERFPDVQFDPRIFECFMDVLPALRRVREQVADRSDDFRGRDAVRMVQ